MLDLLLRPSIGAIGQRDPLSNYWYGPVSRGTFAGENVTDETATQVAAVYACVRVLAEGVAGLPLKVYQRNADGTRKQATTTEGERLRVMLGKFPNNVQSSFEFWEYAMWNLLLRGNFIAFKDNEFNPSALNPVATKNVEKYAVTANGMEYAIRHDGQLDFYRQNEVLHVKGPTADGAWGLNPIEILRNPIGLTIAAERFGSSLFKQGVRPAGAMEVPQKLSPEAYQRLKASLDEYAGAQNAAKSLILEQGAKWSQITMTNEDAQYLELRKFQLSEIARIFRVPPHMIADLDRATFSNIEHMGIEFVVHSLRPWLRRIEQAADRDIINDDSVYIEFNADGLLRGDTKSRYEAYASALQNEWMNADEVRAKENLNPRDDGTGGQFRNPAINPQNAQVRNATPDEPKAIGTDPLHAWAKEIAGRIASKELNALESRASKASGDRQRFNAWANEFYTKHAEHIDQAVSGLVESAAMQEATRVEMVQDIAKVSMMTIVSSDNPEMIVESWRRGELAERIYAQISKEIR